MTHERRSQLLWFLQGLFLCRVLGQIWVVLLAPRWLPAMAQWYSGLIAYPVLLPVQIIILMFMTLVSYDNTRRGGRFFVTSRDARERLKVISMVYAGIMLARFFLKLILVPEAAVLSGTIPIVFHWVLAGYLFVLSQTPTPVLAKTPINAVSL